MYMYLGGRAMKEKKATSQLIGMFQKEEHGNPPLLKPDDLVLLYNENSNWKLVWRYHWELLIQQDPHPGPARYKAFIQDVKL